MVKCTEIVTEADLREAHALVVQACQKVETWKWLESQIASLLAANREAREALLAVSKRRIAHNQGAGENGCDVYRLARPLHGTPGKCSCGADNVRDQVRALVSRLGSREGE